MKTIEHVCLLKPRLFEKGHWILHKYCVLFTRGYFLQPYHNLAKDPRQIALVWTGVKSGIQVEKFPNLLEKVNRQIIVWFYIEKISVHICVSHREHDRDESLRVVNGKFSRIDYLQSDRSPDVFHCKLEYMCHNVFYLFSFFLKITKRFWASLLHVYFIVF